MADASRGTPAPLRLPDELWARVLAACAYTEVVRLACCSRQLRRLGDAPELWRRLCEVHQFGVHKGGTQDWKALFRDRRARCRSCRPVRALTAAAQHDAHASRAAAGAATARAARRVGAGREGSD